MNSTLELEGVKEKSSEYVWKEYVYINIALIIIIGGFGNLLTIITICVGRIR